MSYRNHLQLLFSLLLEFFPILNQFCKASASSITSPLLFANLQAQMKENDFQIKMVVVLQQKLSSLQA
jgi:hypothetical protein